MDDAILKAYKSGQHEELRRLRDRYAAFTDAPPAVLLTTLDGGGGAAQIFNPRGTMVAEMQSSKANAGLIMANDVNGNIVQSLSGSR